MDLNINSPSYYTQEYGVDDDIYWMCRGLADFVKEKKYSEVINIVGIVPIVAPASVVEKGLYKPHKRCELRAGFASVCLPIDYEKYVRADVTNKKILIIENILASVKSISKRGKFDYGLFEKDVRNFCENSNIIFWIAFLGNYLKAVLRRKSIESEGRKVSLMFG